MNLGQIEATILEMCKKYAHARWYVINETSGDIAGDARNLITEIESDIEMDWFVDIRTDLQMRGEDFRLYVFPKRVLELNKEYYENL